MTLNPMTHFKPRRALLAAVLPLALLAGCDSAGSDDAGDSVSNLEAAVAIANGMAVESGGALEAIASGLEDDENSQGHGCEIERTYDEVTQTWTRTIDCERGDPDSRFFARFGRTQTFQFFDEAGVPQQFPQDAASLDFAIVDGYGEVVTPWLHHELLDIGGSFDIDDLQDSLVTVNGTYERSATDSLFVRRPDGPAAVRKSIIYDLSLELDDVRGPRRRYGHWGRPVSGTVTGLVEGTVTFTRRDGTVVTRDFSRSFTIVFGGEPVADTARIRIGSDEFVANMRTGEVEGVE
jgi:hypothetical protein